MFRRLVALSLASGLVLAGCELFTAPRTGYGAVFSVRGTMTSTTCGVGAPSTAAMLSFNVEVRLDQTRLRWSVPTAGITAQSTLDSSRRFTLVDDRIMPIRAANYRLGLGACSLRRFDVLEGRVGGAFPLLDRVDTEDSSADAEDPLDAAMFDAASLTDASLTDASLADAAQSGPPALDSLRETVGWAVAPGADCRDMIGVGPGQFVTLPCEQRWTFDARYEPSLRVTR
jgi:hypothetical protein